MLIGSVGRARRARQGKSLGAVAPIGQKGARLCEIQLPGEFYVTGNVVSGRLFEEEPGAVRVALRQDGRSKPCQRVGDAEMVVSRLMWKLVMAPLPDAWLGLCSTTRYAAASSSRETTSTSFS